VVCLPSYPRTRCLAFRSASLRGRAPLDWSSSGRFVGCTVDGASDARPERRRGAGGLGDGRRRAGGRRSTKESPCTGLQDARRGEQHPLRTRGSAPRDRDRDVDRPDAAHQLAAAGHYRCLHRHDETTIASVVSNRSQHRPARATCPPDSTTGAIRNVTQRPPRANPTSPANATGAVSVSAAGRPSHREESKPSRSCRTPGP